MAFFFDSWSVKPILLALIMTFYVGGASFHLPPMEGRTAMSMQTRRYTSWPQFTPRSQTSPTTLRIHMDLQDTPALPWPVWLISYSHSYAHTRNHRYRSLQTHGALWSRTSVLVDSPCLTRSWVLSSRRRTAQYINVINSTPRRSSRGKSLSRRAP